MLKTLDLFSGIGGFSFGLESTGFFETVAFCEINPFCQKVLKKHWPPVPIFQDIKTLTKDKINATVDLVCGGFPCQPFSVAGNRGGKADDRDLWPEMFRVIKEFRPRWVIGENVAGFINMELDRTILDLESEGYEVWPIVLPACAVGAPHRRDRVWIIAHAGCKYESGKPKSGNIEEAQRTRASTEFKLSACRSGFASTDTGSKQMEGSSKKQTYKLPSFSWCENIRRVEDFFGRPDISQPLIRRGDHGFPGRVDRLKAIGNAVVPHIPRIIGEMIAAAEKI